MSPFAISILSIVLLGVLFVFNVIAQVFYSSLKTKASVNLYLWLLTLIIVAFMAMKIVLIKTESKLADKLIIFSLLPISILGIFYFLMNNEFLDNKTEDIDTYQYKFVSRYPFIAFLLFTILTLILQYLLCLYP